MAKTILIVDDEEDIIEFLKYNLEKESYNVLTASNGSQALELAIEHQPHLVILDVMMPVMDGIEACRKMRQASNLNQTLIVFLTAREEDYMQIDGLEAGGDDYINKPVRPRVLVSKINAMLRRFPNDQEQNEEIIIGDLTINKENYTLIKAGKMLNLPRKEFELLYKLISKPGKVFSRVELLNSIWGEDIYVTDRTIDVHIRKLREKVGETIIKTVKGVGYKFEM